MLSATVASWISDLDAAANAAGLDIGQKNGRDPNDKEETENIPLDPQEQDGLDASNY